jgi:sporulation protein YlmC with PRC-barrel domain
MKQWTKTGTAMGVVAAISMLLVTVATAQPSINPNMDRGSKLIGADVENLQGEDLGEIKDVIIDWQTGRVAYVVIAFSRIMGLGNKYFAVPFEALWPEPGQKAGDQERYLLNVDKEQMKNAPGGFDQNNWPNMSDRTWGTHIYKYYNLKPYWERG